MIRIRLPATAATLAIVPLLCWAACPASAQIVPARGFYGVARAGVSIDPEQKLRTYAFDAKTKYKSGFTGELGGGYDFGVFRLEQTAGYMQLKPKNDAAASGRTKAFTLIVSGFADIPTGTIFTPYVGIGGGIARVDARLSGPIAGVASAYSGKDYGLLWHGSAGLGIDVAPHVTLEVGGRYQEISKLKFNGIAAAQPADFKPKLRTISGTVGLRYRF